jgi:cyclophilin family peptidyl-prolyl cis-trans isomerase
MAKHKAATSVTIASTTEQTAFHLFVERNWKSALVVFLVVSATIIIRQCVSKQATVSATESWERLGAEVSFGGGRSNVDFASGWPNTNDISFLGQASALADLAADLGDDPAGPWAKALEVAQRVDSRDYDGARAALMELQEQHPEHPVVSQLYRFDADGAPQGLATFVQERLQEIDAWETAHPLLFGNPPLPEGSPRVRIETEVGQIVLGLYEDDAPQHTANFLKLCGEGFYNDTRIHRVVPGRLIQGGDPNSRSEPEETWGLGGPDYTIAPEANGLRHFPYVLAMAKKGGDVESSGSQFYITVAKAHDLDERYVVFGAVLEGAEVVDKIAGSPVTGEKPQSPVRILTTEVLQ